MGKRLAITKARTLQVRVSYEEAERVKGMAAGLGMSVSAWCRGVVMAAAGLGEPKVGQEASEKVSTRVD